MTTTTRNHNQTRLSLSLSHEETRTWWSAHVGDIIIKINWAIVESNTVVGRKYPENKELGLPFNQLFTFTPREQGMQFKLWN